MTRSVLMTATVLTGLSVGLITAFSYAIMPGLRRTSDAVFVEAMRGINVAILNPLFALTFGGALISAVAAVIVGWNDPVRPWVIAGLVLYAVGVIGVTFTFNIPLNDALEAGKGSAAALRQEFEDPWTRLNHIRSVLGTASFVFLVFGVLKV